MYRAIFAPAATVLAPDPAHGGQITPGAPTDISGSPYRVVTYHVDHDTSMVDVNEVERVALEHRPHLILAGWSAYPRMLHFRRFREIADAVGAYLLVDMSHLAGWSRQASTRTRSRLPSS